MRMVDLIEKKKHNLPLSTEEIQYWIKGAVDGTIPDYQSSSLLMAIWFNGINDDELHILTQSMIESGDVVDLSTIKGVKVDKHSTGGVGDTTTLVLAPVLAACGAKIAKMSGKALGFTGGTIDKLESIPGFCTSIDIESFKNQVDEIGLSVIGATENLVPADKILYSLRDITGTVDSIPLIASSVMSKKLACGADVLLLEVTYGNGAFMKNLKDAKLLAEIMVKIGKHHGEKTIAMVTSMEEPLGKAVGNNLEVIEAINALQGKGPEDLMLLCQESAAILLTESKIFATKEEARKQIQKVIKNGQALMKFAEMVAYQKGDVNYILHPSKFAKSKTIIEYPAKEDGYIKSIDSLTIGNAAMKLGAGRITKIDRIDLTSGLVLAGKVGDYVNKGETLFTIHTNKNDYLNVIDEIYSAYQFSNNKVDKLKLIEEIIY